jgi:outer membrane protein assembly factor BamB
MKQSARFPVPASVLELTVATCLLSSTLPAADWPQWRGPQRNGQSSETGLLQEWPKDGPKLVWQVKDIGSGYSTPSVVGDHIYLLSNNGLENEFALALSAKDGNRVWSARLGDVGNPKQEPNYPAARSTPTVDGKLLYALSSDGDLVCLETANGKERWRKSLRRDFGGQPGVWAYAESPLIDGNALICTPGGSNVTMIALNKNTGDVIWKCALAEGGDASYGSAIVFESGGVRQYVQFLQKGLIGVEAKTGKLLWRYERSAQASPAVIMTPLADNGYIYSGAFRAGGAVVKPVRKDGTFVADELYFNNKLPVGLGGVVKVGNYLYGSSGATVMCVDFMTGDIKWEERAIGPSSWLVADGRLYLHAEKGEVALLEPTPEAYREKGRFTPPDGPTRLNQMEKAWAYPVIADGRLYIRDQSSLWAYDIRARR